MSAFVRCSDKGNDMGKGTPAVAMSRCALAFRHIHLSVSTVCFFFIINLRVFIKE